MPLQRYASEKISWLHDGVSAASGSGAPAMGDRTFCFLIDIGGSKKMRTVRGDWRALRHVSLLAFFITATSLVKAEEVTGSDSRLQEVVVTAEKREQLLTDVGAPVTAFS